MGSKYKILIMGASYGSLLGTKLALAGHAVHLICLPAEVLDAYRRAASRTKNLELHVFPGVLHGYMMPDNVKAFHRKTRDFSMARALAILEGLRAGEAAQVRRKAG